MTFQQVSEPYDAYDVLVVGGSGVDTVVPVGALPLPLTDSAAVPPIREGVGHTGTGVALGCAALGLTTGFVDFIGDDHPGSLVRARMAATGVDFRPLISPHGTRRAVNLVAPDGRRMSFYDARDPLDLRMPPEHYLPALRRARHVHLSITHFARFLYDDIEALGLPVSTDLHDWDGLTEHHREFALRSDLVFLSTSGAGERIASVMREILHEGRAEAVIATAGAAAPISWPPTTAPRVRCRPWCRPGRSWTPTARATPSPAGSSTGGIWAGAWRTARGWAPSPGPMPVPRPARTPPSSVRTCCARCPPRRRGPPLRRTPPRRPAPASRARRTTGSPRGGVAARSRPDGPRGVFPVRGRPARPAARLSPCGRRRRRKWCC